MILLFSLRENFITDSCFFQIYEGSIIVRNEKIIALANHLQGQGVLLNQISFDDKLRVDEILGIREKSNRKEISQVGSYTKCIFHFDVNFQL